ncbi:MAG: acyl-CoA desaturase [Bacteroidetes bacterium]|nr:acyl-CoA desaturase [Bacteroidota bacterium]
MNGSHIRFIAKDKSTSLFFATLRERVDQYFRKNNLSKHANTQMVVKTMVLLSAYIFPFIILVTIHPSFSIGLLLWAVMGFALAGIGMSIMHDANHGAYSSNSNVNYWLGHSLNLCGGSVFNWKMQHNILHHTYTNVFSKDHDISDKLIMRFSPHTKVKWYHRFQFLYAFLFYGILTIYWTFLKDFIQFKQYIREGVNRNTRSQNQKAFLKIILSKLLYFFLFLILPLMILKMPAGAYLAGFLLMQFISGVVLTVVFQLAHTVEKTTHPTPDENHTIENNWAIHQMNTTVNFSRKSKMISWYVGGLNFQVEHHLFPSICHVHYPQIAGIVKTTAEEFNIPYLENKTFFSAFRSHVRLLKEYGKMPPEKMAVS